MQKELVNKRKRNNVHSGHQVKVLLWPMIGKRHNKNYGRKQPA